jgi:hypothetical protein
VTPVSPSLWRRVLVEKRSIIVPLAAAALVNIGVYALVVYPLGVKSAGAADRATNATRSLQAAEQDFAGAKALVTGKSRAEQELTTFYGKVLPASQMAAVRLTYLPLTGIAKKTHVTLIARHWQSEIPEKDARLARLKVLASLAGDYQSFRQFIYELETAPEFVIIDHLAISLSDVEKPLAFTLELSTYYPLGTNGN